MRLPEDEDIDVYLLSSVFNNTSATYKFYWFLAIIELIEEGNDELSKFEIFCKMLTNAWFTVTYSKISFGKQDKIQEAIKLISGIEKINLDENSKSIYNTLKHTENKLTQKIIYHFDLNVPHKFLSPWLGSGSLTDVQQKSQSNYALPPYALYKSSIVIQPAWFNYFTKNSGLLKSFCYWHLTRFLQSRNPNVPDIAGKLFKPEKRSNLYRHKKDFWDIVIQKRGFIKCIYTNEMLNIGSYDIEHFIPFQFVAHDLMWNLLPASPIFNRIKGDKLPDLDYYFDNFYSTQKEAVEIIKEKNQKNIFLEHYLTIFPDLDMSKEKYRECLQPLITIASNNGFLFLNKNKMK